MRLTVAVLGWQLLDIYLGPEHAEAEPEFEPYQDAGNTGSTIVGFTQDPPAIWEDGGWRRGYDEPSEGDEGT